MTIEVIKVYLKRLGKLWILVTKLNDETYKVSEIVATFITYWVIGVI